jgi:hypothetical protein
MRKMPSYVHITYQTNAVKVTERMIPHIGACHATYKATNAQIYLWCVSYGIPKRSSLKNWKGQEEGEDPGKDGKRK